MLSAARRRVRPIVTGLVAVVVFVAIPLVANGYLIFVATVIAATAIATVGLSLLIGPVQPGGAPLALSFGQSVFLAIGAYGSAILETRWGINFPVAMALSAVLAGLVGAAIALPGTRLGLFGLGMSTFSLAFVIQVLAAGRLLGGLTGSNLGLPIKAVPVLGVDLASGLPLYYVTALLLAGALVVGGHLVRSRFGQSLRLIMRSEHVATAMGIRVIRQRVIMFVIASIYTSIAGALIAHASGIVTPESVGATKSVDLVAMVIVGGVGTLAGPVVGAVYFTVLSQLVSNLGQNSEIVSSLTLLIVLVLAPAGMIGVARDLVALVRRRRGHATDRTAQRQAGERAQPERR